MDNYPDFKTLGAEVKRDNADDPDLPNMSDEEMGVWYAENFPDEVMVDAIDQGSGIVKEGPKTFGGAISDTMQEVGDFTRDLIPSPMDVVEGGFDMVGLPSVGDMAQGIGDAGTNLVAGALSGASGGVVKNAGQRLMGPQYGGGMAFGAGEIVGEVLGPMKLINKVLGPLKATSLMGKAGRTAAESSMIEGGKGLVDFLTSTQDKSVSDIPAQAIIGGIGGGVVDAGARGLWRGGAALGKKVMSVAPENLNKHYIDFMKKHGQKILPSLATINPTAAMRRTEDWMKESSGALDLMAQTANELQTYATRHKNTFLTKIGSDPLNGSNVGKATVESFKEARDTLHKESTDIYKDLIRDNPSIRDLPIRAREDITLDMSDGTQSTYNILEILDDAVKGVRPGGSPPAMMQLKKRVDWIKKNHAKKVTKSTDVYSNRGDRMEQQFTPGDPTRRMPKSPDPLDPASAKGSYIENITDPDKFPMGQREEEVMEYMTYDQWWTELQGIGQILGSADDALKGKIGRVYHQVQDAIDEMAVKAQPDYTIPIRLARDKYTQFKTFRDNPVISKILTLGGEAASKGANPRESFAKITGEIFSDADYIREAKRVLPPEQFAMLRSVHIKDMVWDATRHADKESGAIESVDATKLLSSVNDGLTKTGGFKSDYWTELFSDDGFQDALGQPLAYNGGGPELLEQLKELTRLAAVTDVQMGKLAPGSEGFSSAMAERFALGRVLQDPIANTGFIKSLVSNIMANKALAKHYLEQGVESNKFLQDPSSFVGDLQSGGTRQNVQTSLTNMLTGAMSQ
tara:strand:+ start:1808 stop:4207 length:2400 start_codon:yes stop_codon:yes gene_type:complete